MGTTRLWRDGAVALEGFPVADISDHTARDDSRVWADFVSPTEQDLAAIAEELDIHPLTVEDAVHEFQRTRLTRFENHGFLALHAIAIDEQGEVTDAPITAFLTKRALVTVHGPEFDMTPITERWDKERRLLSAGVPALVWALLDHVVDGHFAAAQELDSRLDVLEDDLFDENGGDGDVQRRSFAVRKSLTQLRKVATPTREIVATLLHREPVLPREIAPYYQDVFDHTVRVIEWADTMREVVGTVLETHVALQGNRANAIMKQVTSWAAIIAVPTAITGFFGQNVPFPGEGEPAGVVVSSVLIVTASAALYAGFKRRGWL